MLIGIAVVKYPSLHQVNVKGLKIVCTDLHRSHPVACSGMVEGDGGGIVERVAGYMGGFGYVLDARDIEQCLADGFKLGIPDPLGSFQAHYLLSREALVPGLHVFHLLADDYGSNDKESRDRKLYYNKSISKARAARPFGNISFQYLVGVVTGQKDSGI